VSHIVKPRHEDDHTPQASFVSSDAFGGALEIVEMEFVLFHVCELILRVRDQGVAQAFCAGRD